MKFSPSIDKRIVDDLPDYIYHSNDGYINSSMIKSFAQSPKHFERDFIHLLKPDPNKEAFIRGRALHTAVLEPHLFDNQYLVGKEPEDIEGCLYYLNDLKAFCKQNGLTQSGIKKDIIDRILNHFPDMQFKIWDVIRDNEKRQSDGKTRISKDIHQSVLAMKQAILDNPAAKELLSTGKAEVSYFGQHRFTGLPVKARFDYIRADNIGIDVKTCRSAAPDKFVLDVINFGYGLQQAHYTTAFNSASKDPLSAFCFIAVEIDPPHVVQIYELDESSRDESMRYYQSLMIRFKHCTALDDYPGYTSDYSTLSLPSWYLKKLRTLSYEQ